MSIAGNTLTAKLLLTRPFSGTNPNPDGTLNNLTSLLFGQIAYDKNGLYIGKGSNTYDTFSSDSTTRTYFNYTKTGEQSGNTKLVLNASQNSNNFNVVHDNILRVCTSRAYTDNTGDSRVRRRFALIDISRANIEAINEGEPANYAILETGNITGNSTFNPTSQICSDGSARFSSIDVPDSEIKASGMYITYMQPTEKNSTTSYIGTLNRPYHEIYTEYLKSASGFSYIGEADNHFSQAYINKLGDTENYISNAYITSINDSPASNSSDKTLKKSIYNLNDSYENVFNALIPKRFKYKEDTQMGSAYKDQFLGFIAQDVKKALDDNNITSQTIVNGEEGNYALSYMQFIPLNTWQIQKLKKRVSDLEERLAKLENRE